MYLPSNRVKQNIYLLYNKSWLNWYSLICRASSSTTAIIQTGANKQRDFIHHNSNRLALKFKHFRLRRVQQVSLTMNKERIQLLKINAASPYISHRQLSVGYFKVRCAATFSYYHPMRKVIALYTHKTCKSSSSMCRIPSIYWWPWLSISSYDGWPSAFFLCLLRFRLQFSYSFTKDFHIKIFFSTRCLCIHK